jgi:histidinol-phosphatase (PHP family)
MDCMALAARDRGMAAVCFTDHVEMDDSRTGLPDPDWKERWSAMLSAYGSLTAAPPEGIEVRLGMELGSPNHDPELAARIAATPELDLILGSLHNLRNVTDFYYYAYTSEEECAGLNRMYLAELLEIAELDYFDVMAHIGYTCRYMSRAGFRTRIDTEHNGEELRSLLSRLIDRGRGIEVNTSGMRQGNGPYPGEDILTLYRRLGGEIVTIGSDGHRPQDAGAQIAEAAELLRTLGFRYYAEYYKRKPVFRPL